MCLFVLIYHNSPYSTSELVVSLVMMHVDSVDGFQQYHTGLSFHMRAVINLQEPGLAKVREPLREKTG